jgi:hypothetical protein
MALAIRTRSLSVSVTLGPMSRQPGPRQAPASEHLNSILGGSISLPSVQSEGTQAKTPAIPSASGRTSLPEAKLGSVWEVQVRRATRQSQWPQAAPERARVAGASFDKSLCSPCHTAEGPKDKSCGLTQPHAALRQHRGYRREDVSTEQGGTTTAKVAQRRLEPRGRATGRRGAGSPFAGNPLTRAPVQLGAKEKPASREARRAGGILREASGAFQTLKCLAAEP